MMPSWYVAEALSRLSPPLKRIAKRMDLTLNRDKTRVTRVTDGFDFLGFNFVKRKSPRSGKHAIYIFPAKSAQQKIRNRLKYCHVDDERRSVRRNSWRW